MNEHVVSISILEFMCDVGTAFKKDYYREFKLDGRALDGVSDFTVFAFFATQYQWVTVENKRSRRFVSACSLAMPISSRSSTFRLSGLSVAGMRAHALLQLGSQEEEFTAFQDWELRLDR